MTKENLEHIEKRNLLLRFKLCLAEREIDKFVESLDDEERSIVIDGVREMGYDTSIITNAIPVKEVKKEPEEITNAFVLYKRNQALRNR